VTAFFVPWSDANGNDAEVVYARIRETAQAGTGHEPQPQRIFKLWFRRAGVDIEAEVGRPDPDGRRTVLAILDLGRRSPYLIHSSSRKGSEKQVLVDKPVYAVTEFTS
jgi:hypothetical protein